MHAMPTQGVPGVIHNTRSLPVRAPPSPRTAVTAWLDAILYSLTRKSSLHPPYSVNSFLPIYKGVPLGLCLTN